MSAPAATSRRHFIIAIDAAVLRQSRKKSSAFDLSPRAVQVYMTMRALGNGKTGHLAIRGTPLDWRYIARQARVGRDVWQAALRELIWKGWVTRKPERVEIYRNGRKRVVWGRCHYWVHKQPQVAPSSKIAQKPYILPMPDPTAAEEPGTQIISETPRVLVRDGSEACSGINIGNKKKYSNHHHQKNRKSDDDSRATLLKSNPDLFLPEEDGETIRRVRQNLAADHPHLVQALKLETISDDWFAIAMNHIEGRGKGKISSPVAYFTKAFANLFANITADSDVESDRTLLDCINGDYNHRLQLRAKHGIEAGMVTTKSEERRQEFLRMRGGGP